VELTAAILARFHGGQFAVKNPGQRLALTGEIDRIEMVRKGDLILLQIRPAWLAMSKHFPPRPDSWEAMINIIYKANPLLYTASDDGAGRIKLHSEVTGETTILYPKGQVALNRSDVKGL
jgi:hypothetical protein